MIVAIVDMVVGVSVRPRPHSSETFEHFNEKWSLATDSILCGTNGVQCSKDSQEFNWGQENIQLISLANC